jgi:hypothetical protein
MKRFITFVPKKVVSEEEPIIFDLVVFDFVSGNETTVLENVINLPIRCSPDGSKCLVGNRFEEIIFMQEKVKLPLLVQ